MNLVPRSFPRGLCLGLLAAVFLARPATAQIMTPGSRQQLQQQVSSIQQDLTAVKNQVTKTKKQLDDAQKKLDSSTQTASGYHQDFDSMKAEMDQYRADLDKAQAEKDAVAKKLTSEFEVSVDYQSARVAYDTAVRQRDATKTVALVPLKEKPEYVRAGDSLATARDRLERVKAMVPVDTEEVIATTSEINDTTKLLKTMEGEVLAKDKPYLDAEAQVTQTKAALDALRAEFEKQLAQNPDYTAQDKPIADLQAKTKSLGDRMLDTSNKMRQADATMSQNKSLVTKYTADLATYQQRLDSDTAQLSSAQAALKALGQ